MSNLLPLFPLRLVAFPGERLNLHVFEPRYKQLINECHARGTTFGIPAFIEDRVQSVGTEMKLLGIEKVHPNGEMDVRTQAIGIFRIVEFWEKAEGRLYSAAEIERLTFDLEGDFLKNERILELLAELYDVLNIHKPLPEHSPDFNTFKIAHVSGLTIEQEHELLCLPEELRRQEFMLQHLEKLLPMAKELEELRLKVQMNGHFKNILPPKV